MAPEPDDLLAYAALPTDALQCPWCSTVGDAVDGPCAHCGLPLHVELT